MFFRARTIVCSDQRIAERSNSSLVICCRKMREIQDSSTDPSPKMKHSTTKVPASTVTSLTRFVDRVSGNDAYFRTPAWKPPTPPNNSSPITERLQPARSCRCEEGSPTSRTVGKQGGVPPIMYRSLSRHREYLEIPVPSLSKRRR